MWSGPSRKILGSPSSSSIGRAKEKGLECYAVPRLGNRTDYGKYPKTGTSKGIAQSQKTIPFWHRNQIRLPIFCIENIIEIQPYFK